MLTPTQLQEIKAILFSKLNPKKYRMFIFGSRAIHKEQRYSDVDIGIEGSPLSAKTKIELEEAFEQSDLPYRIDLVDFSSVSTRFKHIATKTIIPLQ